MARGRDRAVVFWRNPVTALSLLLVLIVGMTGLLVYFLPIVDNLSMVRNREYSIFEMNGALPSPGFAAPGGSALSDIDLRLYWVERNLEYGHPGVALDEVKNILVLAPDNRDALLLAGQLYERLGRPAEEVDVMRRYHDQERSLASAYALGRALWRAGRQPEAITLLQRSRLGAEHSGLLDLLLAELLAETGDGKGAVEYWNQSRLPDDYPLAADYPALHALLLETGEVRP